MRPVFKKIIIMGMVLLPLGVVSPVKGHAALSGKAEWSYADYRAEENGAEVQSGHHFWQEYSLFYKTGGEFLDGRAGEWSLGLGGQFLGLSGHFDENVSEQRFKPLYRGEAKFAPGGIPLRLHVFSKDMTHGQVFNFNDFGNPGLASAPYKNIIKPGIATTINNGTHVHNGATLMLGIRNGSYLGRYRNTLSRLPRLLMDYRETRVKDLKASAPQHFRERNLAFVSLNKKDNWAHYRFSDFVDYLDSANNWTEAQYILGTVTPAMRRHWIQMTNWIKVSVDGTYETLKSSDTGLRKSGNNVRFNLFSRGQRSNWEGSSFARFERRAFERTADIDKFLSVPVYFSGTLNADTALRFWIEGEQTDQLEGVDESRLYGKARLEGLKRQRYQLVTELALETEKGRNGTNDSARMGVEMFNNRNYDPPVSYYLSYDLSYFSGSSDSRSSEFWENTARFGLTNKARSNFEWGLVQKLTYGTGSLSAQRGGTIQASSGQPLAGGKTTSVERSGDVWRSMSKIYVEMNKDVRHRNRFEAQLDYVSANGVSDSHLKLSHRYDYEQRRYSFLIVNEYSRRSEGLGANSDEIFHRSRFSYKPNRTLDAHLDLEYSKITGNAKDYTTFIAEQELAYSLFKVNGFVRKLFDVTQGLTYRNTESETISSRAHRAVIFSVAAGYYPWQPLKLTGKIRYDRLLSVDTGRITYDLGCRLTMSKMQVKLLYSYGQQIADSDQAEDRNERRWELNVERVF